MHVLSCSSVAYYYLLLNIFPLTDLGLCCREEVAVRFPLSSGLPKLPLNIIKIEEELKLVNWKRERCAEDLQREESLLKNAKSLFDRKRQELVEHQRESLQHMAQVLPQMTLQKVSHNLLPHYSVMEGSK